MHKEIIKGLKISLTAILIFSALNIPGFQDKLIYGQSYGIGDYQIKPDENIVPIVEYIYPESFPDPKDVELIRPRSHSPIIKYRGHTFATYNFMDGRSSIKVVEFDKNGNVFRGTEISGISYLKDVLIIDGLVVFYGPDKKILMPFCKLFQYACPQVEYLSAENYPDPCDYGLIRPSEMSPVIRYLGNTFATYSYMDGRNSIAIVEFDEKGLPIKINEIQGISYSNNIAIDEYQKVIFKNKIGYVKLALNDIMKTSELRIEYFGFYNYVYPKKSELYCSVEGTPVLIYGDNKFFTYNYKDGRDSIAIVQVDKNGNIISEDEIKGIVSLKYIGVRLETLEISLFGKNGIVTMPLCKFLHKEAVEKANDGLNESCYYLLRP